MTDHSAELLAAYRLGVLHGGKIEQLLFSSGPGGTSGSAPERQSPAGDQDRGLPLDGRVPTRDHAPGGRGPRTTEPVAWGIAWSHDDLDCEHVYESRGNAKAVADNGNGSIIPLFLSPTLTDEERWAVSVAMGIINEGNYGWPDGTTPPQDTLRGLLERLK